MTHGSLILCYGADVFLLHTRVRVLERAGLPVEGVHTPDQLRAALGRLQPAILLICHTVSATECAEATALVAKMLPTTGIVLMFLHEPTCNPKQRHILLGAGGGPSALLRAIKSMLVTP